MRRLLALSSVMAWITLACSTPETPKPPSPEPQQAASAGLNVLQRFVTASNFQAMGFASQDEVKNAQLGQPMSLYNIGLEALRQYEATSDLTQLLTLSAESVYPVTVGGEVKSSVTIIKREGGYQISSFGNGKSMATLSRYRQSSAESDFIVRVPALNVQFLGRRVGVKVFFVPVTEDARFKLAVGEAVPAEVALAELVPVAKAYNGLPM